MITVGLLVLFAGFAALAGQTWGSGGGHRVGGPERLAEFVGALREEDGPLTSWTAELEWHEDLREGGHHRLLAIQAQDWGRFQLDSATGTMTATVTTEAPDLLLALDAVLLLVGGIAATNSYYESALSSE